MDSKEKRKQYYLNNKDKLLTYSKKYYYDNSKERRKYNQEYWALNGHKYIEKRSKDIEYKAKQRDYYLKYRERTKYIHQDNYFHATSKKHFIVNFSF
jgi:hypothetical protein